MASRDAPPKPQSGSSPPLAPVANEVLPTSDVAVRVPSPAGSVIRVLNQAVLPDTRAAETCASVPTFWDTPPGELSFGCWTQWSLDRTGASSRPTALPERLGNGATMQCLGVT